MSNLDQFEKLLKLRTLDRQAASMKCFAQLVALF
ncbi:hypothetical protein SAMN06295888_12536 [Desulfonatronum zhilinae]|nr:hypothetical protein SAMN06295888_12536 [Desulfonatronum zhilinae]